MAHFFLFILVLTQYKLESHPVIKNKVEQVNLKIVELKILYIMLIYYDLLFGNTNLFFFIKICIRCLILYVALKSVSTNVHFFLTKNLRITKTMNNKR